MCGAASRLGGALATVTHVAWHIDASARVATVALGDAGYRDALLVQGGAIRNNGEGGVYTRRVLEGCLRLDLRKVRRRCFVSLRL